MGWGAQLRYTKNGSKNHNVNHDKKQVSTRRGLENGLAVKVPQNRAEAGTLGPRPKVAEGWGQVGRPAPAYCATVTRCPLANPGKSMLVGRDPPELGGDESGKRMHPTTNQPINLEKDRERKKSKRRKHQH